MWLTFDITYSADGDINVWKGAICTVGRGVAMPRGMRVCTSQNNRGKLPTASFFGLRHRAPGSASPSREKKSPNKVLARQQANLLKSLFQGGVRDGLATFGVQRGNVALWNRGRGPFQGPWKGLNDSGGLSGIIPFRGRPMTPGRRSITQFNSSRDHYSRPTGARQIRQRR